MVVTSWWINVLPSETFPATDDFIVPQADFAEHANRERNGPPFVEQAGGSS